MIKLIVLLLVILQFNAYAQEVGYIGMDFYGEAATDLYDSELDLNSDGTLSSFELDAAHSNSIDLSSVDPLESDIWLNQEVLPLRKNLDNLELSESVVYKFVDTTPAPISAFSFLFADVSNPMSQKNFTLWMSKDSRSILLKKNILRKLGYAVPKTKQIKEIKIKFRGLISLNQFIKDIKNNTFGDSARWVIAKDEKSFIVTLQDVIVIETNSSIYNLTNAKITEDVIRGRRVLNALAIPFLLVDVRESVDGVMWNCGRIENKQFRMNFHGASEYSTTHDDARWILKKLASFTKDDLKEIVDNSAFPASVGSLLVEKLSSRLNWLLDTFKVPAQTLSVDESISSSDGELVNGRLTQNAWSGHASRYSYEDTESPFTTSELIAFFRSKLNSSVISNLVKIFNEKVLVNTDIQKAAIENQLKAQQSQIDKVISTGEYSRIPFKTWGLPTLKINAFLSRDIVTGSYLGTDNRIQVADSLEVMGDVGYFVGTTGLPTGLSLFGSANARYTRTYSHVKSIHSIKKALQEDYRNIIIPYLTKNKSNHISEMIKLIKDPEFRKLEEEERNKKLIEILGSLQKVLKVGESLIVSDNFLLSANTTAGVQADVFSNAVLNLSAKRVNISRYHILRKDEKTIQIYKSYGKSKGYGFGFNFNYYLPIVSMSWRNQKGTIKTMFNSLTLSKDQTNEELETNLSNLYQALYHRNLEVLNADKKPYKIEHAFREHVKDESVLFLKGLNIKMADKITIKHPEGFDSNILVRSVGYRKGRDYQQFTFDTLNALIKYWWEPSTDITLANTGSGDPGDSYKGISYSRSATLESPLDDKNFTPFGEYISIHSRWKGWSAKKQKMNEIANDITSKFGPGIITKESLGGMHSIDMYSFDVYLSLYDAAIEHLLTIKTSKVKKLLKRKFRFTHSVSRFREHNNSSDLYLQEYSYGRKKKRLINRASLSHAKLVKGNLSENNRSFHLLRLVNTLNLYLPINEFYKLVGGIDNTFVKANVSGFRGGMEDGEKSLILNTLGEVGSEHVGGALETIKNAIGISTGELGAFWFIRRIQ